MFDTGLFVVYNQVCRFCFLYLGIRIMINVSDRQKKQELLSRLDRKAYSLLKKKSNSYRDNDIKAVIRGLIKIQEGCSKGNEWVLDSNIFNNSRLISGWHYMSMDLSI
jgi:hypothetical protein